MFVMEKWIERERERMKDIAPRQRTSVWGLQSGGGAHEVVFDGTEVWLALAIR